MMTKISILKNYRNTQTLNVLALDEVAQMLQSNEYMKEIADLREEYPLLELQRKEDGSMSGEKRYTDRIPRLCFSAEMLMSLFQKPEATSETNPQGGVWLSLKDISARLKKAFKSGYKEDEGSFIKIGNYLSRPEYKFENRRKTSGFEYWVKEKE